MNTNEKWADYGISEVSYNSVAGHIDRLLVHEDLGDKIGVGVIKTKGNVISEIEEGLQFVTITKNLKNSWIKGQPVKVAEINGVKYLKTERNYSEADNLESLPEF